MKDSYSPTCDSIQKFGLDYPLMICKFTQAQWMKMYNDPCYTMNDDGFIYGVIKGNMKTLIAKSLNYVTIDCMIFNDPIDAAKMGVWHDQCDPLHDDQCRSYMHVMDYTTLRKAQLGRYTEKDHIRSKEFPGKTTPEKPKK